MHNQDILIHTFKSQTLRDVVNSATEFFIRTPVESFPPGSRFNGGGVYALYFMGEFELYSGLALTSVQEDSIPIYVGKAVPSGWRTARKSTSSGTPLFNRINEHYRNIEHVNNLSVADFKCRYMVLDEDESGIIGPVEANLIRQFQPLWNTVIDGFGNHTPGEGRFNQAKSGWDVLHPGRSWAERCKGRSQVSEDIVKKINLYMIKRAKI